MRRSAWGDPPAAMVVHTGGAVEAPGGRAMAISVRDGTREPYGDAWAGRSGGGGRGGNTCYNCGEVRGSGRFC